MIIPWTLFKAFVTANFTHANVTDISGIPAMKTVEEAHKGSSGSGATIRANGLFKLIRWDRVYPEQRGEKVNESYTLDIEVMMPTDTAYEETMVELDADFRTNNHDTPNVTEFYYLEPMNDYRMEEVQGMMRVRMDRMFV